MTFFEFNKKFPTEQSAINYFYQVRYNNILTCPHCGAKINLYRTARKKVCICHSCNNTFSPFSDTIFRKSKTDMRLWFYAIHLILNDKKGISGCQLQRELGVTYKTAWRMLKQIREAMSNINMRKTFEIFVEIDETYIGGKPRKENKKLDANNLPDGKTKSKRGRGTNKTPVIGIIERSSKKVYAKVALPNKEGKKLTGKQLLSIIDEVCKDETTIVSDDFSGYKILDKKTKNNFFHFTVNHSQGQYSAGNGIHTNSIESFWSLIKRQHTGTHHHYSVKYMQNYINEMSFRQNNRKNQSVFDKLLKQSVGF
ncbi:MAG: IS1595 family transposase [Treponema sp.]|nr:IS1595 family transposase [Treponema sp.]MCL2272494.1 IS1595 family transposase [Treponema sp.]